MRPIRSKQSFPVFFPFSLTRTAVALAALASQAAFAQTAPDVPLPLASGAPVKSLGMVTISSGQPTSLPTQIPTTMEGVTREQIEQTINATDSEDALKYLPSLLVRKRYIGDYNHAILSSRASGTGNSARSAVYADGILLSNYLGNGIANGTNYAPRWGLVTPEEIERVDVMYGPFSAAYPGNSVGAVVDYVTRMPTQLESHAKLSGFNQNFKLYGTDTSYGGTQASASLGNRNGDWSWFINVNRTKSAGQPLTFTTKLLSTAAPAPGAVAVTGAVPGLNTRNVPWLLVGGATQYDTEQAHAKLKLAYDFSPTVRASYTLGYWDNTSQNRSESYLRNAAGAPVYSGNVSIDGRGYNLAATDFGVSNEALTHVMHGLSVKSNIRGVWDWEVAASVYSYQKDQLRAGTTAQPGSLNGGAGTLQDQDGTGWNNLAFKGIWRPDSLQGAHIADFGYQQDSYKLHILKSSVVGDWISGPAGALVNEVGGRTQLRSVYAQDAWAFAPKWKTVLGARIEYWNASNGFTRFGAGNAANTGYASRSESFVSPKAALSYQWASDTVLKAATGRAVRFPTVGELYGATASVNSRYLNDPNLQPEKSWTSELTAEKDLGNALLRFTLFTENVRDSLYSQTTFDPAANLNVSRVQNVGRIKTHGMEVALNGTDVLARGLDFNGSATYADSRIKENSGFVATPGDTLGKYQPRVPAWRATALVSYRFNPAWTGTLGARYSGSQFSSLDNSDVNGFAYMGTSKYFTTDVRLRWQISKQVSAALGIDNLNNYQYWNFHPYPQRTYSAELKFDL
ncbi:TonB-dependent receptor [Polaromonas sp.]|uniref:TonB-dependent receptor n=1 Tax=Polaromonas sp. TaxID=1869339 RepID=UPI0013BD077A|nr:TonB-dependent receptor [Polaromonas sp.]NDP62866.1 TonB-dependent receptor [Polaromonas sp.]